MMGGRPPTAQAATAAARHADTPRPVQGRAPTRLGSDSPAELAHLGLALGKAYANPRLSSKPCAVRWHPTGADGATTAPLTPVQETGRDRKRSVVL